MTGRTVCCGDDRAGFPLLRAQGTIYRGWVKVKNGDLTEGIFSAAQRFGRLPWLLGSSVGAPSYRPPGQGM